MARPQRFTIYDMMEAKGVFDANPANAQARSPDGQALYAGPVEYPKMLYHPQGAERVTVPAEIIVTPLGPKAVGEQRELIYRVVNNEAEEQALRAEGWHTHPASALRAAGKDAPATGADMRIAELEKQLASLQKERDALQALTPASLTEQATAAAPNINPVSKPLNLPGRGA